MELFIFLLQTLALAFGIIIAFLLAFIVTIPIKIFFRMFGAKR